VGYGTLAENIGPVSRNIQQLRWKVRFACGFKPEDIVIPERFYQIETFKGPIDRAFFDGLIKEYAKAIRDLGGTDKAG